MLRRSLRYCLLAVFALLVLPVFAQGNQYERIISFHSDIIVQQNAAMQVTETISVYAQGAQIRHGIYRDFPTRYRDPQGNAYVVEFTVDSVTRDGAPEPYHTEAQSNGTRIYIGDRNSLVSTGQHTYTLSYTTNRQLGFFKDHDELYWNVTGNGWIFPIEQASATVTLPAGISREQIKVEGYTGRQGAQGQAYRASVDADGKAQFVTTQPLGSKEGLTIVVSFPKGVVQPPTTAQKTQYLLRDNLNLLIGIIGLLLVVGYFYLAWHAVGKDPAPGVIIPRYTPPAGCSPAAIRFIRKMGYDHKALAATIINTAVKGYLTISEAKKGFLGAGGSYIMTQTGKPLVVAMTPPPVPDALAPEEAALVTALFQRLGPTVTFDNAYYREIQQSIAIFTRELKQRYQDRFFSSNWQAFLPGVLLTLVVAAVVIFLTQMATGIGGISLAVVLLLILLVAVNVLFYHLMKVRTPAGRQLLDEIEGFRMYLEVAEKDELNLRNPPQKTPELFEAYLPYALALDVEQAWSQKFAAVLAQATVGDQRYQPGWYSGMAWSSIGAASFASSLGNSFSNAIASSSTSPSSSSGSGGGGSSGGGGGGGGGGGW